MQELIKMESLIELAKILGIVIPAVWYLSERFKTLSAKIDVLETRLEGKIDARVALLDQKIDSKIALIELQIKQYSESSRDNKGKVDALESSLQEALRRIEHLEAKQGAR